MFDAIATRHHWPRHHPHRAPPPISVGRPLPSEPARLFGAIQAPSPWSAPPRIGPAGAGDPALEPRGRRALFGRLVQRDLAVRLAARGGWTLVAACFQCLALASLAYATAHLVPPRERPVMVEVKFIRPAVRAARPGPPPPPPPLGARRSVAARPRAVAATKPPSPTALHQPREIVPELAPARPGDAMGGDEDGYDEGGVEGGVVGGVPGGVLGGVVGGVIGGVPGGSLDAAPLPAAPAPPRVVKYDDTMTPPRLVSAPPLEYTEQALEREVEGVMVVECVVAVDGTVHACHVLASLPFMDRAVIDNLERRRYRPATLAGRPLDVQYTFTIRFKLPQ